MNGNNCKTTCWLAAVALGWLIGLYLWVGAEWGFFWSLIVGVIVSLVAAWVFPRIFCSESSAHTGPVASTAASVSPVAPTRAADPTPTPTPKTQATTEPATAPDPEPTPVTNVPDDAATSGDIIKTSTDLPGQSELAGRKGAWRYEGEESKAAVTPTPKPAPVPAPEVVTDPAPAAQSVGTQPKGIDAAREGGADDLKMIKGVGPALEKLLNSMGFFHFDQIAAWGAPDVAWVDENLKGFKGRVTRDTWVDQAKSLAAGEETEFAKRAKKDGIYK